MGLGGDGSWEQSLGRLAVVVAGGHAQGQGGEELVGMVLPWVAQLAGAQLPLTIDAAGGRAEPAGSQCRNVPWHTLQAQTQVQPNSNSSMSCFGCSAHVRAGTAAGPVLPYAPAR